MEAPVRQWSRIEICFIEGILARKLCVPSQVLPHAALLEQVPEELDLKRPFKREPVTN